METRIVKKFRSAYRRKRKCRGNQYTKSKTPSIQSVEHVDERTADRPEPQAEIRISPTQNVSASAKKVPTRHVDAQDEKGRLYENKPSGFRFMDMQIFCELTSVLACPECYHAGISVSEVNNKRYGNASFLKLQCNNCDWKFVCYTSRKAGRAFEVNRRIVYAFRAIGRGRCGAAKLCGLMNMPPPLQNKAYNGNELCLKSAAKRVAEETMAQAAEEIHSVVGTDTLAEAHISAYGTWQRRGHSSLHGVVSILSMETGTVLDTEVLTQFCKQCSFYESDTKNSLAYDVWRAEHASKCNATFKVQC